MYSEIQKLILLQLSLPFNTRTNIIRISIQKTSSTLLMSNRYEVKSLTFQYTFDFEHHNNARHVITSLFIFAVFFIRFYPVIARVFRQNHRFTVKLKEFFHCLSIYTSYYSLYQLCSSHKPTIHTTLFPNNDSFITQSYRAVRIYV